MPKFASLKLPRPIPIVRDGAIANPSLGDGRLIPVLVLDATNHPEVTSLIQVHEHTPPGDVTIQWASPLLSNGKVLLHLTFVRPTSYVMVLQFDASRQGGVVEGILLSHGLLIVAGKPGDRLVTTLDDPRIILEIPDTGFLPQWTAIFRNALRKRFKREGLTRAQSTSAADAHIARGRELWMLRQSPRDGKRT